MSTEKIHASMLAVMRGIGAISKSKTNSTQGFKYRGIDQVYAAVHPMLIEHGIFMTSEILERFRDERETNKGGVLFYTQLKMRYWFNAEDGSRVPTEVVGEGMDSGDKASNKAMAVAHKYAILQAFCVPTEEVDDPDAQTHQVKAKPKQSAPPATQTQTRAAAPAAEKKSSPSGQMQSPLTVTVLNTAQKADKKGKAMVVVKTKEALPDGKFAMYCYRENLFAALGLATGEQCVFSMESNPTFPMILDVIRIGDEIYRDGKPESDSLGITDDDIPF